MFCSELGMCVNFRGMGVPLVLAIILVGRSTSSHHCCCRHRYLLVAVVAITGDTLTPVSNRCHVLALHLPFDASFHDASQWVLVSERRGFFR